MVVSVSTDVAGACWVRGCVLHLMSHPPPSAACCFQMCMCLEQLGQLTEALEEAELSIKYCVPSCEQTRQRLQRAVDSLAQQQAEAEAGGGAEAGSGWVGQGYGIKAARGPQQQRGGSGKSEPAPCSSQDHCRSVGRGTEGAGPASWHTGGGATCEVRGEGLVPAASPAHQLHPKRRKYQEEVEQQQQPQSSAPPAPATALLDGKPGPDRWGLLDDDTVASDAQILSASSSGSSSSSGGGGSPSSSIPLADGDNDDDGTGGLEGEAGAEQGWGRDVGAGQRGGEGGGEEVGEAESVEEEEEVEEPSSSDSDLSSDLAGDSGMSDDDYADYADYDWAPGATGKGHRLGWQGVWGGRLVYVA